jgi:outer membrane murein-binding lipoprotein Lpp
MACTEQTGAVRSKECKMQQIRSFLSAAWASFRGQPRRTQAIIAAVSGVVLLACCAISAAIGNASSSITTTGASNSHTSAVTHATATAAVIHATATAKPKPTRVPATATPAPAEPPFVGGPYANFTHKYGAPINSNNWFYADSGQTIIFAVKVASGTVNWLSVLQVPSDWTDSQTFAECALFLPPNAAMFNHDGPYTDYHSSIGEVIINAPGGNSGTCTVYTGQG